MEAGAAKEKRLHVVGEGYVVQQQQPVNSSQFAKERACDVLRERQSSKRVKRLAYIDISEHWCYSSGQDQLPI